MKKRRLKPIKSRKQIARAMAERCANQYARDHILPLPFPNPWDVWDPTKVDPDATPEQIAERYLEFSKLCPPSRRIKYIV